MWALVTYFISPANKVYGVYTNNTVCLLSVRLSVHLSAFLVSERDWNEILQKSWSSYVDVHKGNSQCWRNPKLDNQIENFNMLKLSGFIETILSVCLSVRLPVRPFVCLPTFLVSRTHSS